VLIFLSVIIEHTSILEYILNILQILTVYSNIFKTWTFFVDLQTLHRHRPPKLWMLQNLGHLLACGPVAK
jgi:hypothetical protein